MRAAVLGHPIEHSLSPVLHRSAYAALGLDWRYDAFDVTADALPAFLSGVDAGWAGLSLTMPLKRAVLPLLNRLEPLAERVGVVNTVLVRAGGHGLELVGANTDVPGIRAALCEGGLAVTKHDAAGPPSAVVLGAGATAASALAALAGLGFERSIVVARDAGRADDTVKAAERLGIEAVFRELGSAAGVADLLAGAAVVVSTLPPGAADAVAAVLGAANGLLLDCAYTPRPAPLVARWRELDGNAVVGELLLLHQAAEQVRLMTDHPAPLAAMRAALAEVLG